jgi:tetratricopeptide (TPR) repeat protein
VGNVAIQACSRAIASGKYAGHDLAALYTDRGFWCAENKKFERAISDYSEAIRFNPKYPLPFFNRAGVYARKKDYDLAIADYTEAIRLYPKFTDAFVGRGATYVDKKAYSRALADFDEAIRLEPWDSVAWNDRCQVRAVVGRELQQALADCNKALQLRPSDFRINYLSQGKPDEVDAAILDSRGLTYLRLGQVNKAISDYNAALKLDSKQARSLYGRGLAKQRSGDSVGGDADIALAKKIQPNIADEFASNTQTEIRECILVKYRPTCVPVEKLTWCKQTISSFVNRVCYDEVNEYMVIELRTTNYHYCEIPKSVVQNLLDAKSKGRFYNTYIKGHFDCRIHRMPEYD